MLYEVITDLYHATLVRLQLSGLAYPCACSRSVITSYSIHYTKLYEELTAQQDAITDSLTGLLNRDGFLQKIEGEITACCNEANTGFAILIVDLDGFRRVNESMGLASGDQILSITAHRLRASLKSTDVVSRLGNDS